MEIEEKIELLKEHITRLENQLIQVCESQLKFNNIVEQNIIQESKNIKILNDTVKIIHEWKLKSEGV